MKHVRINKQKKAIQMINSWNENRIQMDKGVFDVVLKTLYVNGKAELDLEKEIFAVARLKVPHNEADRLWNVLISSGWVAPAVGFGKAGKVELTKAGYQLMATFGGYKEYLESLEASNKPQTIIMPFSVESEDEGDSAEELPEGRKK
jgi:hypothetical protein